MSAAGKVELVKVPTDDEQKAGEQTEENATASLTEVHYLLFWFSCLLYNDYLSKTAGFQSC